MSPVIAVPEQTIPKARRSTFDPKALARLPGVRHSPLPAKLEPQLATLVSQPPIGDEWLNEIKFDGYRMICRIDRGKVKFISRNQLDWTRHLRSVADAVKQLPVRQALLDGEVVAMQPNGTSDFQRLQNVFRSGRGQELVYYVFDLMFLDGFDLRGVPLLQRKEVLKGLLKTDSRPKQIRYSDHIIGHGPAFYRQADRHGLEGIVCKRRDGTYKAGRNDDWRKVKCVQHEEFVVGGFTNPDGARGGFGSLLVGYYEGDDLVYAGRVGTGFSGQMLTELRHRMDKLTQRESPFREFDRRKARSLGAHWIKPVLVAEVGFSHWTRDGRLRHPSFLGLREDKNPKEVVQTRLADLPLASQKKDSPAVKLPKQISASGKKISTERKPSIVAVPKQRKTPNGAVSSLILAGVRISSPEKILYPEQKITKRELAEYYFQFARWTLPHVADRPLSLVRCPEGIVGDCFYQKHPGMGTPASIRQVPIRERDKTRNYLVVDNVDDLMGLAQIGALEIHVWGSQAKALEKPDRMILDLDPDPSVPWPRVVESAHEIREFLLSIGLQSFVKTTGGKGVHIVVPIQRRHDWDAMKDFSAAIAEHLVSRSPDRYTANMSKAVRGGKILIDYHRNGRGATAIAPYSPRSRPGAPVSVPLAWDELTANLRPDQFTIRNLEERLSRLKSDPWSEIHTVRQSLLASVRKSLTTNRRSWTRASA